MLRTRDTPKFIHLYRGFIHTIVVARHEMCKLLTKMHVNASRRFDFETNASNARYEFSFELPFFMFRSLSSSFSLSLFFLLNNASTELNIFQTITHPHMHYTHKVIAQAHAIQLCKPHFPFFFTCRCHFLFTFSIDSWCQDIAGNRTTT